MVGFWFFIALFAPILSSYPPDRISADSILEAPSSTHLFGTDQLGRDVLSRLFHGARVSICVSLFVVILSTLLGVFFGTIAGYYGGFLDHLIMRATDAMLCFPIYFLILSLIALTETSPLSIILILGCTGWMGQARLMRAEILTLKEREFVLAARSFGARAPSIIIHHLIPNASAPLIVSAILGVAYAIIAESSLSFLGIGIQPPTPSWGNMLADARQTLGIAWWQVAFPAAAITSIVLGYHLIGEGCRRKMDA